MATVTKRIAKSGATADGRKLPKAALSAMAQNYDPAVYAAKLNIEHYISMMPDSLFCEQGDVLSLNTEAAPNNEIYLLATLATSSQVDDMWEQGKKRAFSIEMDPNFADLGAPYLTGLAVTSYPASLGTHFSLHKPAATPSAKTEKFTFTESSVGVDDHANYTVEYLTMTIPAKTENNNEQTPPAPATAPAATAELPAIPEQFSSTLQHFTNELSAVRQERDQLRADLAAAEQKYTTDMAAKNAEIDSLKQQIPADGYKFRPKMTGNEDAKAAKGGYRF